MSSPPLRLLSVCLLLGGTSCVSAASTHSSSLHPEHAAPMTGSQRIRICPITPAPNDMIAPATEADGQRAHTHRDDADATSSMSSSSTRDQSAEAQSSREDQITLKRPYLNIRYNPARCGCPPYEVKIGNTWVRVFIDDASHRETAGVAELKAEAEHDSSNNRLRIYRVVGELIPGKTVCPGGHRHPILKVNFFTN